LKSHRKASEGIANTWPARDLKLLDIIVIDVRCHLGADALAGDLDGMNKMDGMAGERGPLPWGLILTNPVNPV